MRTDAEPQRKSKRKERDNTTSWVDERYGKLLARQTVKSLSPHAGEHDPHWIETLAGVRRAPHYLAEREVKVGYGVGKKRIRVWHVDTMTHNGGLGIYTAEYLPNGKVDRDSLTAPPKMLITRHALERLYQRLRTNSFDDVVRRALAPLTRAPELPYYLLEAEFGLPGVGVMHAVSERTRTSVGVMGSTWIVKTFIEEKKA